MEGGRKMERSEGVERSGSYRNVAADYLAYFGSRSARLPATILKLSIYQRFSAQLQNHHGDTTQNRV
jgi:hypothetical protein